MTELAELIAGTDPVQAIAIVILVVGCAFALAWGIVGVVRAFMSAISKPFEKK